MIASIKMCVLPLNVPEDTDMAIEEDDEVAIDGELSHSSETSTSNFILYNWNDVVICAIFLFAKIR